MAARKDITNQRFGRLVALSLSNEKSASNKTKWNFICDCGKRKTIITATVLSGDVKSCGCFHAEQLKKQKEKHGRRYTPEYQIWIQMRQRCSNPRNTAYRNYGGRGITVCKEWDSFESFFSDMGQRPPGMSIDRIDNDGPYSPANCRWSTQEQQCNNTRQNVTLELRGRKQSATRWAKEIGISPSTLLDRLYRGWDANRTLTTPVMSKFGNSNRDEVAA